ncbi:DUF2281 domain-containing protein [Methylovulum psychrotolerans]|jgi:hypothetical protein|uniref:DUF2281 domain-containing protein n=1 Tax=Methylovulum psychrotolerans TaxID=1704499 RepID=UPI001BFF518E|nr:DUF2281 domain-containing protein [Methylovulum psychrotolerans]MBT9098717.1 DUF2281 domain-containing protein [Methylovulum psychrotolerans]
MNTTQLINDIEQLPPEAQHQIEDFIAFIKMRYQPEKNSLSDDGFVGMWSDRADMQDSTEWVRNNRQSEWVKSDG